MSDTPRSSPRIEALVDGRVLIEGIARGWRDHHSGRQLIIDATFLRSAYLVIDDNNIVNVLSHDQRGKDDDSAESGGGEVAIRPADFSEIWVDGRLMRPDA